MKTPTFKKQTRTLTHGSHTLKVVNTDLGNDQTSFPARVLRAYNLRCALKGMT